MFTSSAVLFRRRQAVRDLVEAASAHRDAVQRLGITGADKDVISRMTANGRIDVDEHRDAYSTILLAAAMPDDDFASFIGATLILLADRLQGGDGDDDLFHNWDAFREHYRLADPPVRAALMNGFQLAEQIGFVRLSTPPTESECVTFARGDVIATLQSVGLHNLGKAIRDGVSASEAGLMWQRASEETQIWQAQAAYRYLYERDESIAPPEPENVALIPWV